MLRLMSNEAFPPPEADGVPYRSVITIQTASDSELKMEESNINVQFHVFPLIFPLNASHHTVTCHASISNPANANRSVARDTRCLQNRERVTIGVRRGLKVRGKWAIQLLLQPLFIPHRGVRSVEEYHRHFTPRSRRYWEQISVRVSVVEDIGLRSRLRSSSVLGRYHNVQMSIVERRLT